MGKFEVLEYLQGRRQKGMDSYLSYAQVHEGLCRSGMGCSYTSVWRSMNSLWWEGLVEVEYEVNGLQRTALFRAHITTGLQVSDMKRVHNTYRKPVQKSGGAHSGGTEEDVVGASHG